MQGTGYINLFEPISQTTTKVLILVRQAKYGRHIKRRKTGKEGVHFSAEEDFLNENLKVGYDDNVDDLLNGKTIFL